MTATVQIPVEQVVQLFQQLYPTEFARCVAEARASILEARLAELEGEAPELGDRAEVTD